MTESPKDKKGTWIGIGVILSGIGVAIAFFITMVSSCQGAFPN